MNIQIRVINFIVKECERLCVVITLMISTFPHNSIKTFTSESNARFCNRSFCFSSSRQNVYESSGLMDDVREIEESSECKADQRLSLILGWS